MRLEGRDAATLHVTNGDSTTGTLRATALGGAVLSWQDVLTEGPVPPLPAAALREVRARFLAGEGWDTATAIARSFAERDEQLAAAVGAGHPVVLWFEHDLFDQLQLLQILTQADAAGFHPDRLELIEIDAFPGRPRFRGLGELDAAELASLWPERRPVTAEQLACARRAWEAVRQPAPAALAALLHADLTPLPFLSAALRRLLEQLPDVRTGLSRSQRHLLEALAAGARTPLEAFMATWESEDAPFDGDAWAFGRLAGLAAGPQPLVAGRDGSPLPAPPPRGDEHAFAHAPVRLTETGSAVLAGEADAVALLGVDRWVGGTHLRPGHLWRFETRDASVALDRHW